MKIALSTLCLFYLTFLYAKTETKKFSFQENGLLRIENSSGDISINKGPRNEMFIQVDKVQFSKNCLLAIKKINENEIFIKASQKKRSWRSDQCKTNISVIVPEKIHQKIKKA